MVEHHATAAAASGEAIPRPRIERHAAAAASSGETKFANLLLPPKLWSPPTLEEAEELVRYTGEQPPDYSKRLCRRAADALHVVEQLWLREWLDRPSGKWCNFMNRHDTPSLPSSGEYRDAMIIEIDTWFKRQPELHPELAAFFDIARCDAAIERRVFEAKRSRRA